MIHLCVHFLGGHMFRNLLVYMSALCRHHFVTWPSTNTVKQQHVDQAPFLPTVPWIISNI